MTIIEKGLSRSAVQQRMTNCASCSWAVLHDTAVLAVNRSIIGAKMNQGKYALEKIKKRKNQSHCLSDR